MEASFYQSTYIPNSDMLAMHLELDTLRKENYNLKSIFYHQKNEFQRTTEINAAEWMKYKKQVAETVMGFNNELSEKDIIIEKQKEEARQMRDEISRSRERNEQYEKFTKRILLTNEKGIQTNSEINNNYSRQSKVPVEEKQMKLRNLPVQKQINEISSLERNEDNMKKMAGEPSIFSCKKCDRIFNSRRKLETHRKFVHGMRKCNFCMKEVKKEYINRHMNYFCRKAVSQRLLSKF